MGVDGMRVLVADDDSELLRTIAECLDALGASVTLAKNGAELIEALGQDVIFDLVITDISMPWMTGLQAMHSTRYAGLTAPLIVMTALKTETIPDQVRALGPNALLLRKPFSLDSLEAAVAELVPELRRRAVS